MAAPKIQSICALSGWPGGNAVAGCGWGPIDTASALVSASP